MVHRRGARRRSARCWMRQGAGAGARSCTRRSGGWTPRWRSPIWGAAVCSSPVMTPSAGLVSFLCPHISTCASWSDVGLLLTYQLSVEFGQTRLTLAVEDQDSVDHVKQDVGAVPEPEPSLFIRWYGRVGGGRKTEGWWGISPYDNANRWRMTEQPSRQTNRDLPQLEKNWEDGWQDPK